VVLLALGGVLYAVNANKPGHSTSGSNGSGPAHGSLIYQANLNQGAWGSGNVPSPDPTGSASLGYSGSSIDIKILADGASLSGEFDAPALKNYVADVVLRADAGSNFEFDWAVRSRASNETADVYLSFQVSEEAMTLYLSPDGASNQALAATTPVPGMKSGATVDLGIVVNGANIQVYLGGKKVIDVNESTVSGATTPGLYMNGKAGTMHILGVRYYAVA
jgi:hypothetical protein